MYGSTHQTVHFTRKSCTVFILLLWAISLSPYGDSARAQTLPITPSGLNTQVSGPIAVGGKTQFNITGGTRPGDGANLFHSFGQFGVPHNNIANFQNDAGIPTANILGRITGGNISNIYGSILTTDFGNANLFLINPAGFLFGPNATLNVGGMVTFTSADYLKLNDGTKFNAVPSTTADALLSASPVAAFGFLGSNPGVITVQGSQLTVSNGMGISLIGGNVTIESGTLINGTVQPARLSAPEGKIQLASTASPGEFAAVTLQPRANVNGTSFKSYGVIALTPGSNININDKSTVSIRSGQFAIALNDAVLTTAKNAGSSDTISLTRGSSIVTSNSGADPGANIQLVSSHLALDGAVLRSSAVNKGTGGNISVKASSITLVGGAQIASSTDGNGSAGSVHIAAMDSLTISGFDTTGTLTGIASDLPVIASGVFSNTTTEGVGGTLTIVAPRLTVENTGRIATFTSGDGAGGSVSIHSGEIGLKTGGRIFTGSGLDFVTSETRGNGKAGDIAVVTDSLSISGIDTFGANSAIRSKPESVGDGGSISVTARSIALHDQGMIETIPFGDGRAGDIALTTDILTITGGGAVKTSGGDVKQSGTITINAKDAVSVIGIGSDGTPSQIMNENFGNGGTGRIAIDSKDLIIADGAWIRSTTFFDPIPSAQPKLSLRATGSINLTRGADVRVSGFLSDVGAIEMTAQTITLADHARISTLTFENGNAGNISITSNGLTLSGGSQITSSTQGTGDGGNIFVDANSVTLTNGATVSASSTGQIETPGNAGNIFINAGNQFTMTNSSVTTEANQSSGGAIKITTTPNGTVQLTDSTISASVLDGTGGGGSVNIDPQYVILKNNSQILANAVRGPGGNISITTNLLLPDSTSKISASSLFGLNGIVRIQSPYAPSSGKIQPLGNRPLQVASLLNQRCAAVAGGQFSSFTVAGRDSLPLEPGGWLSSPLASAISPPHDTHDDSATDAGSRVKPTEPMGARPLLSLRHIAPSGFLTKAFAAPSSVGCAS